ncbi:hypothetical protein [Wolbachia endosymbiont of Mansonella ozzardi]|uniref:hypothetical protein n=1 Tax=Wolbachia endosymbiont of Mansonella ozzardi TaxID=137464 RepID=UPI001CE13220|nr:hypothetical protein [Wolbachia endosymbiont of Mansonella ozzardi]
MDSKARVNSEDQLNSLLTSVAQSQNKSVLKLLIELMEKEIEDINYLKLLTSDIKKRGLDIKMSFGTRPYNIEYSESVIKKDIPALPAKVK